MRKYLASLLALAMLCAVSVPAWAADHDPLRSYGNDFYASQIGFDSFNKSVKLHLMVQRLGNPAYMSMNDGVSSGMAFAAPISRRPSQGRRQLDCVYNSGVTIWGDFYQTWARQKAKDGPGFRYRATGPVIGADWSNGALTIGVAATYNWGKITGRDVNHKAKHRQTGLQLYGQYDTSRWYVNGSIGYSYNRFNADRGTAIDDTGVTIPASSPKYRSHTWNFEGQFGYKLAFGSFKITPNAGLRLYHERRKGFGEIGGIESRRRGFHSLELPLAVDASFEFVAGSAIIAPRAHFAWVPELARKRGSVEYSFAGISGTVNGAKRARNVFEFGLGVEARITKNLSAHLDYQCDVRSSYYAHRWNLGVGMNF